MSDKIKTLSQAIRLGATFRPQTYGNFCDVIGSCAFGAAFEAVGVEIEREKQPWPEFKRVMTERGWKEIVKREMRCPDCGDFHGLGSKHFKTLYAVIVELNNYHFWTREQIADWLEAQGL